MADNGLHLCQVPGPVGQDCTEPVWAPDGHTFIYQCERRSLRRDTGSLYAATPNGSGLRLLTSGTNGVAPRWYNQGRRVLYLSYKGTAASWWSMAPDGSARREEGSLDTYTSYTAAPRGTTTAWITRTTITGLWILAGGSRTPRVVAAGTHVDRVDQFSPDGRWLAFWARHGTADILYVVDVHGSQIRAVAPVSVDSEEAFSPDGHTLAYTALHGALYALWFVGTWGGKPQLVTNLNLGDESGEITPAAPTWSADGRYVAISTFTGAGFAILRYNVDRRTRPATMTPPGHIFDLLYDLAWQPLA